MFRGERYVVDRAFSVTDSAGFSHYQEYYYREDKLEMDDGLYPNNTKKGKILFKVPEEAKGLKIKLDINGIRIPDNEKLPTIVKSVSWRLE